ncbi:RBBP8 N-terminal-like protein [Hemicordylus capensis]|uniref:RBBP8 N-terminal-like protein n=1 Tax=Hemicordylus capensis TaxID=884348 RepID=UPI0023041C86|nr:RBBP8 N-terminal-like protein [Hemicordylus capensis]
MATETFAEFLNKLKEIHEKEVQGLQTKLNEITNEKCRDSQRIEELFAKNYQLREQQKVLKENVKVLENRLRAGLCDRCQVTQELAKRKQHEFGKAHFQSLQHIFILTNEMNKLREENKSLKEELKRLCSMEDRPKLLRWVSREGSSTPDSPLPLFSVQGRRSSTEKTASQETEDGYRERLSRPMGGDQSPGRRSSPGNRVSPEIIIQEEHALETSSQRIANQLHGTIALLRPGMRSCSEERDCPGNSTSPPASEIPPSPQPERSPSFEAYLRASKSDCHEIASSYETLKFATRKEQLRLLDQHFALHHLGLRNNSSNKDGSFPHHLLLTREVGGRARSQDDWEDQAAILELPDAVVYMKDCKLENRLQFLNHQEKLQYLLTQQRQQEVKAKMEGSQEKRSPSPLLRSAKECKKESPCLDEPTDETLGKFLWIHKEDLEEAETAETMREYLTEAPLDLSDYGKGREALKLVSGQQSSAECKAGSVDEEPNEDPFHAHEAKYLHGSKESEQLMAKTKEGIAASLISSGRDQPVSRSSPCDTVASSETKTPAGAEKQVTDQPDDGDSESVKEESNEPDSTSDSEVTDACSDGSLQGTSMEKEHYGIKAGSPRLPKKRKRGQDSWTKAYKKSMRGGRNGKPSETPADAEGAANQMENPSPAFSQNATSEEK